MPSIAFRLLVWLGFWVLPQIGLAQNLPNIVLIVADDLGWNDVGFHGSDIRTPHIDSLAERGMELSRFYTAPICSPTRAGLLTGKYPDRFGIRDGVIQPRVIGGLPPDEVTLAEMLAEAGYECRGIFGKWHLGHSDSTLHPVSQGFSEFVGHYNGAFDYFTHYRMTERDWHHNFDPNPEDGYSSDLVARHAADFIAHCGDKPFFLYVPFNAPHSPMQAKAEDLETYDTGQDPEPFGGGGAQRREKTVDGYGEQGKGKTLRQTFAAMVAGLDDGVGIIRQAIRESGLDENTIIVFMSDNGGVNKFGGNNEPLRGQKHTEWEGGVRVPAVVVWPDVVVPGSKSDQLSSYIDVFPTFREMVAAGDTHALDGVSLVPVLKGQEMPHRYLFLGHEAIVTQKWKMNKGELYDIENDISETENLASQNPKVVRELSDAIKNFHQTLSTTNTLEMRDADWLPKPNWEY